VGEQTTSEPLKPAGRSKQFAHPVMLGLLLAVVTLTVYWPVTRCDFVDYDDPAYFYTNDHVLGGLSAANVGWAFTTVSSANWHPLTWLSLMLDVTLSGKGAFGPHLTNLLLHIANTVLLFVLLRQLTAATWRSAFVAALFALHPLHVESVAWIAERKDVLSTCFGLLSLIAYARYVTSDRWQVTRTETIPSRVTCHLSPSYWLALIFFALSLMSKPMLVTLPFLLLLLDYWPLKRFTFHDSRFTVWHLVLEKTPFFILSAISCVVTFIAQHQGGAVAGLALYSTSARVGNAFVSYARYMGKLFWPVQLATPYPYVEHWPWGWILSAVALFVGLGFAAVWLRRKYPFGFTGWFWFVGALVPVIGLVQVGAQAMADRYSYVPLIGLFIILAWGGWEAWSRWRLPKPVMVLAAVLLLAAAAWQTRVQAGFWQNSGTLFQHALKVTDNNYTACVNLGTWLSARGDIQGAVEYYERAAQMHPSDPSVLYDLGNGFTRLGMLDEAIGCYRQALAITPNQLDILNNLGLALTAKKQLADATFCFETALKLDSNSASTHNNLATVLFMEHQFAAAARHYREAVRLDPANPRMHANLGDALVKQGQIAEAVQCYREALRLSPGDSRIVAKLQALGAPISN
jgi:protein O-mannosyl-transferase